MGDIPDTVTPEGDGQVTQPVTPTTGEVTTSAGAQPVTTTPTGADVVDWKARFEQLEAQSKRDINALKSSLQSQAAREANELKKQYEDKLIELQMKSMTPDQQQNFAKQLEQRKVQEMQNELMQLRQRIRENEEMNRTLGWFREQGVPVEALDISRGLQRVTESGWNWMSNEVKRLRGTTGQTTTTPTNPTAPQTAVATVGKPSSMTYKELIDRFGSIENVYALIEQRQLSPDILPKEV